MAAVTMDTITMNSTANPVARLVAEMELGSVIEGGDTVIEIEGVVVGDARSVMEMEGVVVGGAMEMEGVVVGMQEVWWKWRV